MLWLRSKFQQTLQQFKMSLNKNILYLVRHGESLGNVTRSLLSAEEDVLTETGRIQAAKLGEHFADIAWSRIYSSDFPRAVDTAKAILAQSRSTLANEMAMAVKVDARLQERHYGDFEGRPYKECFQAYNNQLAKDSSPLSILEYEMPNSESVVATVSRMNNFFQELFQELDCSKNQETVLVVSHSFAIVVFMNYLSSKGSEFTLINWNSKSDLKMMRNVSYMQIEVERKYAPGPGPRYLNFVVKHETRHLNGLSTNGSFSSFASEATEAKQFSGCIQQ